MATETQDEARDAGVRAEIIKEKTANEMEVDGNDIDIYHQFHSAEGIDLNRHDSPGPGVYQVGQSMDDSTSRKFGKSTRKGKGVARMQDSDKEQEASSTLRQAHYIISSDETGSMQGGHRSASGPSTMGIDRQTLGTQNKHSINQTNVVRIILFEAYSTKPRINIAPAPELQKTERSCASWIRSSCVR